MSRFVTFFFCFAAKLLSAQDITWITDCADKNFCLNQGSCTQGNVLLVAQAATTCFNSPILTYTYKIDLFNNNTTDVQSTEDTINAAFPAGTHKVSWRATDNCGNVGNCTYLFTIKDCLPPSLVCIGSLTHNLVAPVCTATVETDDFIINSSDNCTPGDQIQYGIRKTGDGTGFPTPTSITFGLCELGTHALEVWAKDGNNLTNHCFTSVTVQDYTNSCNCVTTADIALKGCLRTADSAKLDIYTIRADLSATPHQGAPFSSFIQANIEDSCYTRTFSAQPEGDYRIIVRAKRNSSPLEGVSTFDLVQTIKHILNIQPFQTVWQRLAADVNASNTVTTFDVVETRKLILGLYDTFPAVPSWRFFRPVANPANLLSAVKDTYQIMLTNLTDNATFTGLDFVGVKMGDSNLSATLIADGADDRSPPLLLTADDRFLAAGETASIPLRLTEAATLSGWQLALVADPSLATIEGVEGLPAEDFSLSDKAVRALWFDATGKRFLPGEAFFSLKIRMLQPGHLSQALSFSNEMLRAEAYAVASGDGIEQRRPLLFQTGENACNGVAFFPPQPNPFGDETTFNLLLARPGRVRLDLFDVSGKRVYALNGKEMAAGYQSVSLSGAGLPGGVFFYRVEANGEVFSGRLVQE